MCEHDSRKRGEERAATAAMSLQMKKILLSMTTAAVLLCAATAHAEPVRCSNEAKTCTAACGSLPDGQRTSTCITVCQARMASCRQTGCWDNGSSRYCGLLRQ
jgi:hypothetical protein